MKIIIGTLLFTLSVFFNSIELSSSTNNNNNAGRSANPLYTEPELQILSRIPRVHTYSNPHGDRLVAVSKPPPDLAFSDLHEYGVRINGSTYPLFDINGQQVIVNKANRRNIVHGQPGFITYQFTPTIPHPENRRGK